MMILMSWARELRSTTWAIQCMWVELLMRRDEKAHIVPNDIIFNAPLENSFGLLHSPMPIICGTRSSDHIIHCRPHSWHHCWWGSMQLKGRQLLLKSCRLLTQEEFFLLLGHLWWSHCLWNLIHRDLHEEDVSSKGQASWDVEHDWEVVWKKGGRAIKMSASKV